MQHEEYIRIHEALASTMMAEPRLGRIKFRVTWYAGLEWHLRMDLKELVAQRGEARNGKSSDHDHDSDGRKDRIRTSASRHKLSKQGGTSEHLWSTSSVLITVTKLAISCSCVTTNQRWTSTPRFKLMPRLLPRPTTTTTTPATNLCRTNR